MDTRLMSSLEQVREHMEIIGADGAAEITEERIAELAREVIARRTRLGGEG